MKKKIGHFSVKWNASEYGFPIELFKAMEIDVKRRKKQRNRRRERAQRMQAERDRDVGGAGDPDSAEEDSSVVREKPSRPPLRRKKPKEPSPLLEEDIIDGFSILGFKTYEDLEVSHVSYIIINAFLIVCVLVHVLCVNLFRICFDIWTPRNRNEMAFIEERSGTWAYSPTYCLLGSDLARLRTYYLSSQYTLLLNMLKYVHWNEKCKLHR